MSVEASTWAWKQGVGLAAKLVLLCLADHSDNDGRCYPSLNQIARKSGLAQRSVQRAVKELREGGLIAATKTKTSHGDWDRNIYQLAMGVETQRPYVETQSRPGRDTVSLGVETQSPIESSVQSSVEPSVPPPNPSKEGSAQSTQVGFSLNGDPPAPKTPRRKAPPKEDPACRERFEKFMAVYPRHKDVAKAWRAWAKLDPPLEECLTALAKEKRSPQWRKGTEYIPYPATWINGERWDDDDD